MKKFGSNWKKLSTKIAKSKQQTTNVETSVSPTFVARPEGTTENII